MLAVAMRWRRILRESRPAVRAIFDKVLRVARRNGPITVLPEKTRIAFQVRMSFAAFVIRRDWVDGHVVLARRLENPRFRRIETFSPRNHLHAFRFDESVRSTAKYPPGWPKHIKWASSVI